MKNQLTTVAFFSNQFASSKGHGVARYAHNLLDALSKLNYSHKVIPVATRSDRDKKELEAFKADTGLRILPTGRWLTPMLWMTIGIPKIEHLLNIPIDIVHVNDLVYPVSTSKPNVITVHDIGSLTHTKFFRSDSFWIMKRCLKQAVKSRAVLLCVSQTTADAVTEYVLSQYDVDVSQRIFIAHEGISEEFFRPPDFSILDNNECFNLLQQPFILAVGKLSPRKNLEVVIKALKKIQSSIPHHLVTVGGDGWDFQNVNSLVTSLGLANRVHFLGYVSDEMLNALYKRATLFIYPSLFEGFGLPVLEAMASGCPVITSDRSSLPEVAGEAAILVDPCNVEQVASAVEAICKDPSLADVLVQKGMERAKQFSWKNCAEQTLKVYQTLVP